MPAAPSVSGSTTRPTSGGSSRATSTAPVAGSQRNSAGGRSSNQYRGAPSGAGAHVHGGTSVGETCRRGAALPVTGPTATHGVVAGRRWRDVDAAVGRSRPSAIDAPDCRRRERDRVHAGRRGRMSAGAGACGVAKIRRERTRPPAATSPRRTCRRRSPSAARRNARPSVSSDARGHAVGHRSMRMPAASSARTAVQRGVRTRRRRGGRVRVGPRPPSPSRSPA